MSEWVTMSPIELSWTANYANNQNAKDNVCTFSRAQLARWNLPWIIKGHLNAWSLVDSTSVERESSMGHKQYIVIYVIDFCDIWWSLGINTALVLSSWIIAD